jgi:hypothetical protein
MNRGQAPGNRGQLTPVSRRLAPVHTQTYICPNVTKDVNLLEIVTGLGAFANVNVYYRRTAAQPQR